MSQSATQSMPFPAHGKDQSNETSPGGNNPVKWEIVARTSGLAPAQIIAGRLRSEGIPVRSWQEAAGQAIGLTVGLLGTGYVAVPEEFAAKASALLQEQETNRGEADSKQSDKDKRGDNLYG